MTESHRIPNALYVEPLNRMNKAQETIKVISLGKEKLGFRLRTDIVRALDLKKGEMVFMTLEKANPM